MGGAHWLRGWRGEWSRWKRTGASTPGPSPAPYPREVLWGGREAGGLAFTTHSGAPRTFSGPMAKQRASCSLWNEEIESQRGRMLDSEPHSKTCRPVSPAPTQTDRHTPPLLFVPVPSPPWSVVLPTPHGHVSGVGVPLLRPGPGHAARLVEGLILETEPSSQLLELSRPNSRGSKVTFWAGSLGF